MWFRNLLVYRLTQNINLNAEALEAALATKPARACANQELVTYAGHAEMKGKFTHFARNVLMPREFTKSTAQPLIVDYLF